MNERNQSIQVKPDSNSIFRQVQHNNLTFKKSPKNIDKKLFGAINQQKNVSIGSKSSNDKTGSTGSSQGVRSFSNERNSKNCLSAKHGFNSNLSSVKESQNSSQSIHRAQLGEIGNIVPAQRIKATQDAMGRP